jgi:hypothetical protein
MGGTILNIMTVLLGSSAGMLIGNRFSERINQSVMTGLGIITLIVGLDNASQTGNIVIPLLATVTGVIIGELMHIDRALENFGDWLQRRFTSTTDDPPQVADNTSDDTPEAGTLSPRERFITGFVTASLVFCVGPLTFVGAIQDGMGLESGFQFLLIKSLLDMFASMAFASTFGVGVLFTVITILVVQGGLALFGAVLVRLMSDAAMIDSLAESPVILEMTAVGGVLLIGLSLVLLDIKRPRVANFLPALIIAPLLVVLAQALGITIYPL